ncbi:hypothetical protein BH18VER1_BH18VER1_12050 [soil metagenome]
MLTVARFFILTTLVLTSCRSARHAAVSTFRVIDAPARYVRERIDNQDGATTTTTTQTTVTQSDVANPGRPIDPAPQRTVTEQRPTTTTPRPTTKTTRTETAATSQPPATATPRPKPTSAPTVDFPTARPVPGKPGFVYSIDPNGGMVDVTGYKSGDKAKDPYTHQIFVVP